MDFDVGFYRGNKQVWMRSDNDVKEFLKENYDAWEGAQRKGVAIIEIAQKSLMHVMKSQGRARRRRQHTN